MDLIKSKCKTICREKIPDCYLFQFLTVKKEELEDVLRSSFILALASFNFNLNIEPEKFFETELILEKNYRKIKGNLYCQIFENRFEKVNSTFHFNGRVILPGFNEYVVYDENMDDVSVLQENFENINFITYSQISQIKMAKTILFLKTETDFPIPFSKGTELLFEECDFFRNSGIQKTCPFLLRKELFSFYKMKRNNNISSPFTYFFPKCDVNFHYNVICRKIKILEYEKEKGKENETFLYIPLSSENFPFTKLNYTVDKWENLNLIHRNFRNVSIIANLYRMGIIPNFFDFKNEFSGEINFITENTERYLSEIRIVRKLPKKVILPLILYKNNENYFITSKILGIFVMGRNCQNETFEIYLNNHQEPIFSEMENVFVDLKISKPKNIPSEAEINYFYSKKFSKPYLKSKDECEVIDKNNYVKLQYSDFSINMRY